MKRVLKFSVRLLDALLFFLVIAPGFILFFLLLLFRRVKVNLPNEKKIRRIICMNPMLWEWIEAKGILSHVLLLNHNNYWDHFFLIHPDCPKTRKIPVSDSITILEFSNGTDNFLYKLGFYFLNLALREIRFLRLMVRFIRENEIDVIKSQDPHLYIGIRSLVLRQLTSRPLVEDVRCNYDLVYRQTGLSSSRSSRKWNRWMDKFTERIVFHYADMIFGGNDNNRDFAIYNGAMPEKTFTVRPTGVSEGHFVEISDRRNLKEELGLIGKKVICCLGRLAADKYPQDAVRCIAEISRGRDDVVLLMVGNGDMGKELNALALDLGIQDKVLFLGFQPEERVKDLLYTSDAIIIPMGGSALIEAALSTRPVIAYDAEWHSELIRDGETGFLVPFRDYREMASAVIKVLEDGGLATTLGQNARELAFKQHHPDRAAAKEHWCFDKLFRGTFYL